MRSIFTPGTSESTVFVEETTATARAGSAEPKKTRELLPTSRVLNPKSAPRESKMKRPLSPVALLDRLRRNGALPEPSLMMEATAPTFTCCTKCSLPTETISASCPRLPRTPERRRRPWRRPFAY